MLKAKRRAKKSIFKSVLALAAAAVGSAAIVGSIPPTGFTANADDAPASAKATNAVIAEDFETNEVTVKDGKKYVGDHVYANENVDLSVVDEANGNKALKFMYDVDAADADARSLVIHAQAEPWAQYRVSFYAKRANACHIAAVIRSGLPSNHYCESRRFNFDQFADTIWGENVPDKGMLVQQIIPCDPAGNLTISLTPLKIFEHDTDLGFVIDDILVEKYSEVPEGKTNLITNGNMEQFWDGAAWQWTDGGSWTLSMGSGINLGWDGNAESQYGFKSASNLYLGTADGAPVWVKPNELVLKPNTEYNFGIWVREHGSGFVDEDKLSFRLESGSEEAGDYYKSEVSFIPSQIDTDGRGLAVGQYVKLGGTLKTGEATNYSFVIEYDVPNNSETTPMSWRGYQIDDATLYEADTYATLDYADATKSANVTETADAFSAVEGDKVLQANVLSADASIVYELDVKANARYRAAVDAQKVFGADGSFNANKPVNVRVSVETAADGSGQTLAELEADRYLDKGISTLALNFNSGSNTKLYLRVHAEKLPDSEWGYITNNCLINFKNFSLHEYTLDSVALENNFAMDVLSPDKALTVIGRYDGAEFDVTADASFEIVSGDAVTLDGSVVKAAKPGVATVKATYGGKEATVEITVNDIVNALEAGENRAIKLNETGALEATATYEYAGETEVDVASLTVEIANPEILSYADGAFTALKVGETQVTVSCGEISDTFTVTVPKELVSITATDKLTIVKDSVQNIEITAHYNDGTTETLTEGFTLSTDSTAVSIDGTSITGVAKSDSAIVTVSYGGKQCTIDVKVTLTPTAISAPDFDLTFGEAEALKVTVDYAEDDSEILPPASVKVEIADSTIVEYKDGEFTAKKVGETTVTVTFGSFSDTFKITVYKVLADTLTVNENVTVEKDGTVTVTATAIYNDGSTKALTEGLTVASGDTDVITVDGVTLTAKGVGASTITVSYTEGGVTAQGTFEVTVPLRITKVEIDGGNFELKLGESKTLVVKAYYNDGTNKTVTGALLSSSDVAVTVNGFDVKANKVGSAEITAKFNGITSEAITATVPKELKSVSLGENFSVKIGEEHTLTATAVYNDGSKQEIEAPAVTADNDNVTVTGSVVKGEKAGKSVLTLTFEGKTATVEAEVLNYVKSVSVTGGGNVTVGDGIALTVTVVYADGTSTTVSEGYTVSGGGNLVEISGTTVKAIGEGTAELTVSYGGASATVSVTISPVPAKKSGCGSATSVAIPAALALAGLAVVVIMKKRSKQS